MTGWIVTRRTAAGGKRYDACWRAGGRIKTKTFPLRKAAEAHLTNAVKQVNDRTYVELQPAPVGDMFDRWLAASLEVRLQEGSLKPSTAKSYRSMLEEHLRPAFGTCRTDRLTLAVVEDWRAGIAKQIAAGMMAPKFYVNLRNLLHAILTWGRHPERRYLVSDPLAGLERLRLPKAKKRPHFEPDQVQALLQLAAASPPDDTIIMLVLFSGLRRGELFALRWDDIDPGKGQEGGRLHIRRSIYQGAVTSPKTEGSDRVVDVPQRVLDDLSVYRVMYPALAEGYVFRGPSGRPLDPDTWHRERLVPLLERAQLRLPRSGLHSLRHTYVSLLIALGEDVRYIADQVGHSTTRLTQDLYAHVFSRVKVDAMRRLGAAMPSSNLPAEAAEPTGNTN